MVLRSRASRILFLRVVLGLELTGLHEQCSRLLRNLQIGIAGAKANLHLGLGGDVDIHGGCLIVYALGMLELSEVQLERFPPNFFSNVVSAGSLASQSASENLRYET